MTKVNKICNKMPDGKMGIFMKGSGSQKVTILSTFTFSHQRSIEISYIPGCPVLFRGHILIMFSDDYRGDNVNFEKLGD
jgi:hypothetical protein